MAELSRLAALMDAGAFDELERSALELLARHPDSGVLWQWLGLSQRMQGKDALPALQRAAALLPADAGAHNNLANALGVAGRLEEAMASYARALAIRPDFAEAHNNLGNVLLERGQFAEAAAGYRRALEFRPDYAKASNSLGDALRGLGRLEEALASYARALRIRPDFAEAHDNLGFVLRDLGRLDEAVACFRRAIHIRPDFAMAHSHLGIALRLQGRTQEAQSSCRTALELDPHLAATLIVLAETHADQGEFSAAEALFRRAIALEPDSPEAWAGIPRLRRMTRQDGDWLAQAQRVVAQSLPPRQEVPLRYALGKYFDDVQEFESAFEQFRRANELTTRYRGGHDQRGLTRAVDGLIGTFDRQWLRSVRDAGSGTMSTRPVFIVGMLRSGTTLAEQILASHPAVFGAGELTFWSTAASRHAPAAFAGAASASLLRRLAGEYLQELERLSPEALRVIDKMPANFLHLGVIHAALPNARFIHLRRHPIDTCLSIYFQHFEAGHSYANDLADLAHAYGEYRRIMAHWRLVLPRDVLLELPYEELVAGLEAWSRTMLDFIGLPWDPRCLEFDRTARTVITASKWQVRQKISSASVGRWRHYEPFIGPLRALIDEPAPQPR
ncbi:MAG TPA: tetratricopeptide repeat protein [Steroidobacteraceae bacterium]